MPHLWVFYMFAKLPSVDLRTFLFFSIFRLSVPEYFGSMDQMHSFKFKCLFMIPLPQISMLPGQPGPPFQVLKFGGRGNL